MTDRIGSSTVRLPASPPAPALESRPTKIRDAFVVPHATNVALDGEARTTAISNAGFVLGATGGDGFTVSTYGTYPPQAAGSFWDKAGQAEKSAANSLKAQRSLDSHGTDPSDSDVEAQLAGLNVLPLLSDTGVSHADYTSSIPGCSAAMAYQTFVNDPASAFKAGGMNVRPTPSGPLHDGQRIMLEAAGTPAIWFPIEVHLNPQTHLIHIETLDGHIFRGNNDFQFLDDGHGGCTAQQKSAFQGSSDLIAAMGDSGLQRQHDTWRAVHQYLFDHLAGTTGKEVSVSGSATSNAPIHQFRATTSRIQINQDVSLDKLAITLNLTHPATSNLKITVVSPNGSVGTIWDRKDSGSGGISGTFDLSSAFPGQSAKGTWTIVVSDNGQDSGGMLNSWSIDATGVAKS